MAAVPRLPALDGLRGLAALTVLVYHAWVLSGAARLGGGPVRDLISSGHLAVDVFFVLSGFVLFLPTALSGSPGPVLAYAVRRVARIAPAYWVVLAACIAAFDLLASPGLDRDRALGAEGIAAHVLFLSTEARLLDGYDGLLGLGVNPPLWTLALEASFYVVLPLVAAAFARRPLPWVAGALVLTTATRAYAASQGPPTEGELLSLLPAAAFSFAAGMLAAVLYARLGGLDRRVRTAGAGALAAAAGLLVVLVLAGGADPGAVRAEARASHAVGLAVPALCAALALGVALASPRVLAVRPLRALGDVSYGLYLVHFPVLLLALNSLDFERDGTARAFAELLGFGLAAGLLLAAASWLAVERPARRAARRYTAARARAS